MCSTTATTQEKQCCLHGTLRIGAQRNFKISLQDGDIFVFCKTFWKEDTLFGSLTEKGVNLTERFSIVNSNQFLQKLQNNFLTVQLTKSSKNSVEGVFGVLRLPLHQFFIAYRDASLTSRLNDNHLPVISANKWMPVLDSKTGEQIGELQCLLAIGTQSQIENLETSNKCNANGTANQNNEFFCKPLTNGNKNRPDSAKTSNTLDLLNMLQASLASSSSVAKNIQPDCNNAENRLIEIILEVKAARHLPLTQSSKFKQKINEKKNNNTNFQKGEEPSSYVSFQTKSPEAEGKVYTTPVVEKTCSPVWNAAFRLPISVKYLTHKDERLILKVFTKPSSSGAGKNGSSPLEDVFIGLASIDLSYLVENQTQLNAWFDIIDVSGQTNGQIHVVAKSNSDITNLKVTSFEPTIDINDENLSRVIKRKFTELEDISERLRARLLAVTESAVSCTLPDELSDEQLDEFEHDLNTVVSEDENENVH